MSLSWRISLAATNDLESIWLYSRHVWSERQADRYCRSIMDEINAICSQPYAGVNYGHVRTGYYASKVKSHLIFYRIKCDQLEVVRILHERMDIISQFNQP